ncbi:hypothetical protein [Streptomyces sp. NPDC058326]|uniref:hypothetical protein n=1 Tax=Streptomyces sp. NPDC058326 TaxID=3346447 RepID=UPI0036EF5BB0
MSGPAGADGVTMIGESVGRFLRHEVHAVHAGSGEPLAVSAAFEGPPPRGWQVRTVAAGLLVVTAPDATSPAGQPVRLRLAVGDSAVAVRLAKPDRVIKLDRRVVTVRFVPVKAIVEVVLVAGDPQPTPPGTVTVTVHPTKGTAATVTLTEVSGQPGCYRSAPRVWTAPYHPFVVRVNGTRLCSAFPDTARRTTRIRLVDTT